MCGIGLCQIFLRLSSHQMNCTWGGRPPDSARA
ncbi:hypothetical protein T09_10817 [Trichinella sp. T9]|nr:hypothetical protein T09_10817 [Trichinella sp. T9]